MTPATGVFPSRRVWPAGLCGCGCRRKIGLAKPPRLPRVCALFMTESLFIEVQGTLLHLAFVESAYVEDATLYVAVRDEVHEFEYDDDDQAGRALLELRSLLASRNLLLGSVK